MSLADFHNKQKMMYLTFIWYFTMEMKRTMKQRPRTSSVILVQKQGEIP